MTVNKVLESGKVIYEISGRLDTQTAPDLQLMLDEGFVCGENNIALDFDKVEYLSSAGLRTILYAQKKADSLEGAHLEVINVSPQIMEIFEMTGFTDMINICKISE